ncbi:MAG: hypothetical protein CFE23_04315 [Flavobacterium sp. BFFFF1]|uniref:O-antigen ligase family protein n=1 Tax=Flavobacterium sp. BFFFF1 TaxID=2015557 RepID=UPI000BC51407|nr:O-antigen ligase family protein [Flavobacterium sp. BFFFF1]OYU81325.1 MAG: hypothetical protein CFE23_04315 [Flavobacterium sp. BFFFF1]
MKEKIKSEYFDWLFCGLAIILPFSTAIPNILIGVMLALFISQREKLDFSPLRTPLVYLLFSLFAYLSLKSLINGTFYVDSAIYSRYFFFLVLPVLFLKVKALDKVKIAVIVGASAFIIKSLVLILNFYFIFHTLPLGNGEMINKLLILERPYAGFLALLSILLSVEQFQNKSKHKWIFIISGILGFGFILFISARNSLLTLLLLFFIYLFFYLRLPLVKRIFLLGCILIMIALTAIYNRNFLTRFNIGSDLKTTLSMSSDLEPRFIIWPCAYELSKQQDFSPFFGFSGESDIRDRLANCYGVSIKGNDVKRDWFVKERFNTHSQFIAIFLGGGLLGLLVFCAFLFISLKNAFKDFYQFAIVLAIGLFFVFENVLFRQFGCYIFGFILCFYFRDADKKYISKLSRHEVSD